MKIRSYLKFGMVSSIILTIILIGAVNILVAATNQAQKTLQDQIIMKEEILRLKDINANTVNEARYYTYNGLQSHLDAYNAILSEDPYMTSAKLIESLNVPEQFTNHLLTINELSLQSAALEAAAFEVAESGNLQESQYMLFEPEYENIVSQLEELFATFSKDLDVWSAQEVESAERNKSTSIISLVIATLAFITTVLLILFLMNRKLKPLVTLTASASTVANGDLTVKAIETKAKDEIGDLSIAFNTMVASLRQILTTVNQSSLEVAASAEQLLANAEQSNSLGQEVSSSVKTITNTAQQQLVQMNENATALSEVTTGITNVATSAEDVTHSSAIAKQNADLGQEHLTSTVQQMNSIQNAVHETLHSIQELTEHSNKIEQFVSAIRDISDQTNLLALNASIEAARAGEAGKGFAVVADEVRKLAEQSNVSAEQVSDIIHTLQQKVVQTSGQMQLVTNQVESGVEKIHSTGQSFTQIVSSTTNVSDQMMNVSAIAQQMSASAEEMSAIFDSLQKTSHLTSQNAADTALVVERQDAAIEEITASSNNLAKLADHLNQEVAKFKL